MTPHGFVWPPFLIGCYGAASWLLGVAYGRWWGRRLP